ncbi:recombinase family protein [uncultured Clostridium sp.]|uniref:recombinase family protein n=1 Tax=uncultured Clostridium sp. TaxID=59620 RepID=UPI0028E841F6|nr:recombinase family protein [uncultured Clostridium sp.]
MKKIAIYTRKSRLTDTGDSIGTQIKLVKDYFKNENCEFEIFQDEGFTGGNTKRPAFQLMMEKVKTKKFDTIAIYKIDRIARNIVDFFNIFNKFKIYNVKLVSISEGFDPSTSGGMMMMTMLAGIAEMERMNIKQRVKDNMTELAKKGKWTGGTLPLGYSSIRVIENDKECSYLTLNEDEISIVKDIFNWFVDGYSTRKISFLVKEKYQIYTSPTRISNVLNSPTYVNSCELVNKYLELNNYEIYGAINGNGYLTYQRTTAQSGSKKLDKKNKTIVVPSKHAGIIKSNIWLKAQERLKEISIDPKPRISKYTFLAQMVKCGYCGVPMNVWRENRKNNTYIRFFKKTCKCDHSGAVRNGSRLTIEKAEKYVLEILKTAQLNGIDDLLNKNYGKINKKNNELKKIEKDINNIDEMLAGLTDKFALASKTLAKTLIKRMEELAKTKQNLQEKLIILEQKNNYNSKLKDNIKTLNKAIDYFLDNFNELTIEEKQIEIRKIFEYVTWKGAEKEFDLKIIEI